MNNFAHLKKESPFYAIFPHGLAPIHNIMVPSKVRLEGDDETEAYMLDVAKCGVEQLNQIAELVAKQCGGTKAEVLASLGAGIAMPIRASQVESVSADSRAFL